MKTELVKEKQGKSTLSYTILYKLMIKNSFTESIQIKVKLKISKFIHLHIDEIIFTLWIS